MVTNCIVCQLDLYVIEQIKVNYLEGVDIEELADTYDLSIQEIRNHCQGCIKRPKSTQARYKDIIDKLEADIELVRDSMHVEGEDDEPGNTVPALVQGYARLMSEYKDTIIKLEESAKPEDKVKETIIQVINPLLKDLLRNFTEEVNRLKGEMKVSGVNEDISSRLLEDFFRRTATKLKKASDGAVLNLSIYFGADKPVVIDEDS